MKIDGGKVTFIGGLNIPANGTLELAAGRASVSFTQAPVGDFIWTGGELALSQPVVVGDDPLLGNDDLVLNSRSLSTTSVAVRAGHSLIVDGGALTTQMFELDSGAAWEYGAGKIDVPELHIGWNGLTGLEGDSTVSALNADDQLLTSRSDAASVTIDPGYTLHIDKGELRGSVQNFGAFDFGSDNPDQPCEGTLDVWALPSGNPELPADLPPDLPPDETAPTVGLRIGAGTGDAALNGREVVRVGGQGLIRVRGGSLQVDEGYTLAVHGIPVVHGLQAAPPDCTNGDCPPPPPDCTNGDCPPPAPDCTNGDCTTIPETSNVTAASIAVSGQLLLEGGYVLTDDLTIEETGRLAGVGLIEGNVVNAGLIEPGHSPGLISIDGDFLQESTGRLVLEIAGTTLFDQLDISGYADLGGILEIVLRDGFRPGVGDEFPLITAAFIDYHFDDVVVGGALNVSLTPQGLVVIGVPEPASLVLLLLGMPAYFCRRPKVS